MRRTWSVVLTCLTVACAVCVSSRPVETQVSLRMPISNVLTAEYALTSPVEAFEQWMTFYNKGYANDPKEKEQRFVVFKENAAKIAEHNADASATFKMALNAFADLTFEEFASTRLGLNPELKDSLLAEQKKNGKSSFRYANVSNMPDEIDWRQKGAVTEVKNQAMCGSCWAFSTTGAIEGINAIKTGKLVSLSEQQLVSCDSAKNMGCGGGLMDYAFQYVIKNGGIDTEKDYGYWSWDLPCQRRREHDRPAVTIDSYEDVPVNDPQALKKAVAHQPVSVAICASPALQFYSQGIVTDKSCCENLNHGVLAVGYSESGNDGHWIIKNSWGDGWGEGGYFRLARSSDHPEGACGVYKMASYPVKEGTTNPEVPEICGLLAWKECPLHQQCVCNFSFFGLFCFPFTWGCVDPSVMPM